MYVLIVLHCLVQCLLQCTVLDCRLYVVCSYLLYCLVQCLLLQCTVLVATCTLYMCSVLDCLGEQPSLDMRTGGFSLVANGCR